MVPVSTLQSDSAQAVSRVVRAASVIRIEPSHGWIALKLRELWAYRELLYFLVWRDIKVRYKQTALGVAWAVLQPVMTMLVFSLFFGRLAKIPSDGLPYPIFSLAGLVPWSLFANGLSHVSSSVVDSTNLIKKVYFPRLMIPIGALLSALVDFCLALVVLLGLMVYEGLTPSVNVVFFPLFVVLALVTCLGAGLWLAALNVQYRDVRYVVPFMIQLWLFASPIVYPSSMVTGMLRPEWQFVYGINPMVGVIEGTRWSLLGANTAPGDLIVASSLAALLVLVSGAFYFRRMERTFADVL
jgi:lipopolysaccharide transport system permease protein